jgi:hypothetical protein
MVTATIQAGPLAARLTVASHARFR